MNAPWARPGAAYNQHMADRTAEPLEPSRPPEPGRPHGAAMAPPGLDPLAEERAASMADEGGRSAAAVESQDPAAAQPARGDLRPGERPPKGLLARLLQRLLGRSPVG